MSKFHSYMVSAISLINSYNPGKPLAPHIRSFFAANKKFGSRDRKTIAALCYYHFRLGQACEKNTLEESILTGLFMCENNSNELLAFFREDLNAQITLPLSDKINLTGIKLESVFPFYNELGDGIDGNAFTLSFFTQPKLYLRIRPGKKNTVVDKLRNAAIVFELAGDDCMVLANNVAADKLLQLNKEAVVQDLNSQKVLNYLDKETSLLQSKQRVAAWDCCAASGGKSILLYDKLKKNVQLTVSDIRENILSNLDKRLQAAGVNINRSFITDLSVKSGIAAEEKFAIIICDAPCTGSGTWSRSPEQLHFFKRKKIAEYVERQQQIVLNVIPQLAIKGLFFYITCSVFAKENEGMVAFIKDKNPALQLMQMEYLKGYENSADTMFVAVFQLHQ